MLVDGCSSCAQHLASCSACLFPEIPQSAGTIEELLCMCCRVLAFVLLGGETCLFGELLIPIMHQ